MKTESELYSALIDIRTYQPFGERNINYAHIKKSDHCIDFNEAGLLLVAGLMLEREQLDILIINDTPFTQDNMRNKRGRFVWDRYTENSVNAYNIDVLKEFIEFASNITKS